MSDILQNATLSNFAIRRRSIAPNPNSYEQFLEMLYDDIDFGIKELSKYRDICHQGLQNNTSQGEDLINAIICIILTARGWQASHDTSINGHADIVVTLPYEDYQWIGEGKLYGGSAYSEKGFKQLAHRYSTGLSGQNAGGLLVYINTTNLSQLEILQNWKRDLQNMQDCENDDKTLPLSVAKNVQDCCKNPLIFYSHHKHPSSGLDYIVRHMTVDFRHQPKENSKK